MSLVTFFVYIGTAYIFYAAIQGWRTGQIKWRSLQGDRVTKPVAYWFLMALHVIAIVAVLLAALGVYGEINSN